MYQRAFSKVLVNKFTALIANDASFKILNEFGLGSASSASV